MPTSGKATSSPPDGPDPAGPASLPRDADGPVFDEPWMAQAFAMAVELNAAGVFTWREWTERIGAEIARAGEAAAGNEAYYLAWLAALEGLVAEKGLATRLELTDRRDAWDRAARATPHGQPIVLGRDLQDKTGG